MGNPFRKYANGNGTYNGVKLFADLSGLSTGEIQWTFNRLKHLMHVEKKSKDEAKAIVKAEVASKPWESAL